MQMWRIYGKPFWVAYADVKSVFDL